MRVFHLTLCRLWYRWVETLGLRIQRSTVNMHLRCSSTSRRDFQLRMRLRGESPISISRGQCGSGRDRGRGRRWVSNSGGGHRHWDGIERRNSRFEICGRGRGFTVHLGSELHRLGGLKGLVECWWPSTSLIGKLFDCGGCREDRMSRCSALAGRGLSRWKLSWVVQITSRADLIRVSHPKTAFYTFAFMVNQIETVLFIMAGMHPNG